MKNFNLKEFLNLKSYEDFDKNWDLTKWVSNIIETTEGRQVIIHILDIWESVNEQSKPIWLDLVENAGFYPYYAEKVKNDSTKLYNLSFQQNIRMTFYKSKNLPNIYFHKEQKRIELDLSLGKNIAVSAPTSFGKSLLIEEMVARNLYDNILIIQPTLALINETRKKLNKYSNYYNIIVNTNQKPLRKNIFILTAERVVEFLDLPRIDFFVIDEFYKISGNRKDSRIDALNVALLKVMKDKPQAMFLTPTIDALSEKFQKKYDITFYKTDYSLVNTNWVEIRNSKNNVFKSGKEKKAKLFKLLSEQLKDQSTIVYVKSPGEAYKLANEYLKYLGDKASIINPQLNIYEWIDRNVSIKWSLKRMLKYGIGAHNGVLPRHVINCEIDLFNARKIKLLFSTASLIEGVNTVAKNIVIYSKYKGKVPLDFFDFTNISGRAGRMNKYYTGYVYIFPELPSKVNFMLDVPAIDQNNISDEILVNIPKKDVKDQKRRKEIECGVPVDLMNLFRKNLISIDGQRKLVDYIRNNLNNVNYLKWKGNPTFDQLQKTLQLAYHFLKGNDNQSAKRQTVLCRQYLSSSLFEMIKKQIPYSKNEEKAIENVFKFIRKDATYEIPKLLAVVNSLQAYVFQQKNVDKGDYTIFISNLENGNIDPRVAFFIDYNVPRSALKKIADILGPDDSLPKLLGEKSKERLQKILIPYEYDAVKKALEVLNKNYQN